MEMTRRGKLELSLEHMRGLSVARIDMWTYGFKELTGVGYDQPCGVVGCLAGHIQTMAEYRVWEMKHYRRHAVDIWRVRGYILAWLGYEDEPQIPESTEKFGVMSIGLFGLGAAGEKGKRQAITRLKYLLDQEPPDPPQEEKVDEVEVAQEEELCPST